MKGKKLFNIHCGRALMYTDGQLKVPNTTAWLQTENIIFCGTNNMSCTKKINNFHQYYAVTSCLLYKDVLLKKTHRTHLKMMVNWVAQLDFWKLHPLQLHLEKSHPNLLQNNIQLHIITIDHVNL